MEQIISPELIAGGVLLAAAIIYLFRLSFALWARGYVATAMAVGIPTGLLGFGLIMASLGFGTF